MSFVFKFFVGLLVSYYILTLSLIRSSKIKKGKDIPIVINNYNRLTSLCKLIDALTSRGYNQIYIIDNNSTYPPLLKYYESCPFTVFRLKENLGFKALWKSELKHRFCRDYYIYTDSDVVPSEFCPDDFIDYFFSELKKRPLTRKIGFSLRIDNLPDSYSHKEKVINWEKQFYTRLKGGLYRAPIDTTFALYRPYAGLSRSRSVKAYRTAHPYQAEHLPWYINSAKMPDEEKYYVRHSRQATTWTSKQQNNIASLV